MNKTAKLSMTDEQVRYWQELRRSGAASPHKNRKRYDRKRAKRDLRHE